MFELPPPHSRVRVWGHSTANARVVTIADDSDGAIVLALQGAGYSPAFARAGLEPHCVLLDLDLPSIDAMRLAMRFRRSPWGSRAFVIATSALCQEDHRAAVTVAGFDMFLPKPLNVDVLLRLLTLVTKVNLAAATDDPGRPSSHRAHST
jgi:DNA-binding response OmpR family regulator